MRYCDLTIAYTETSGGIRTYIDQKRQYIRDSTADEHVLIIPGARDRLVREGRLTRIEIDSPPIPGAEPYRFFLRPARVRQALAEAAPDVVELGSFLTAPWAAFRYRDERRERGRPALVSAYFHTDIAHAYVGAPLRKLFSTGIEEFSDTLAQWGERFSALLESGAEVTFGQVFKRCDLTLAATAAQAERMAEYGASGTEIVPLGVDLRQFSPSYRSGDLRATLGLTDHDTLLMYCGRLDGEKHVQVLVEALRRLPVSGGFHLAMMGEGPLRADLTECARTLPQLHILPYQKHKATFACQLASADVYVTAGPHETFGLSVVEAMASGLPVVGVDAGALRERVRPSWGRLAPVDDPTAMARCIAEVTRERHSLGAAARQHILSTDYSWEHAFDKLLKLYANRLKPAI